MVLTSCYLNPNQLLEVRVDIQVTKWAGSLEIGVTTHDPETLEFPSTMTNVQPPGTWMMSGGSVVCDGETTIEEYGPTLDEIKVLAKDVPSICNSLHLLHALDIRKPLPSVQEKIVKLLCVMKGLWVLIL